MSMMRFVWTVALVCLAGCDALVPDRTPSSGACVDQEHQLEAGASEFHRDDLQDGAENAFINMAYAGQTVQVAAYLRGMPDQQHVGTHRLPLPNETNVDSPMLRWELSPVAGITGAMRDGTIEFTRAENRRVEGSWTVNFDSGETLRCTFNLRRAYELDTDD